MDIIQKVLGVLIFWFFFFGMGALNLILGLYHFVVIYMSMHEWTWAAAGELWICMASAIFGFILIVFWVIISEDLEDMV